MSIVKNIDLSTVLEYQNLVEYNSGQVVSKTLAQNSSVSLTLFAFDKGEEISSHASNGDAIIYILDGTAKITIGKDDYVLNKGETIVMPSEIPHAVLAQEKFKMLLTVIF